jgi:4-hydroxy-4-methyl-2-oxoglutarate aldolase
MDVSTLRPRFLRLYSGAISDVLDDLGYTSQVMAPRIASLRPGARVAGPAFTMRGRHVRARDREEGRELLRPLLEMLDSLPSGCVVVSEAGEDAICAAWGELCATTALSRGCTAAVIDGGCRDTELILKTEFEVFCRFRTPIDSVGRWTVESWNQAVTVGGVRVRPGDYIVGDGDGIVVVPAALTLQVLEEAERVSDTEDEVRRHVAAGGAASAAFDEFGRF